MRTLLDRKNFSSRTNGQVASRRVTGFIIKGFDRIVDSTWSYLHFLLPILTEVLLREKGIIAITLVAAAFDTVSGGCFIH